MSSATRRQGTKHFRSNFYGVSLAARMDPKKFPTGIGEQATLGRGICAGFWSPRKLLSEFRTKASSPTSHNLRKKNRRHQVDTCRKASNRDNSGNRNSGVPQPKVESSRHWPPMATPIRAFRQTTVVPQHRIQGVKKRRDVARDEANTSARPPATKSKTPELNLRNVRYFVIVADIVDRFPAFIRFFQSTGSTCKPPSPRHRGTF